MTQQDYEQKKKECWEEFRTHVVCGTDNPKGWFDRAFDRAYALGKQEKDAEDGVDLKKLDKMLNDALEKETRESLNQWLSEKDADTVIQGWVFVDETTFDRILCVRKVTQGDYEAVWDSGHPEFCLGKELYPDMVPNKLPEPVEIIIKRRRNV